jgi:16S rRNA (cytosine967-C5)-methyltransferase
MAASQKKIRQWLWRLVRSICLPASGPTHRGLPRSGLAPTKSGLADELLDRALASSKLNKADRALTTELFYGCLRQRLALEFLREQLMRKPPRAVVAVLMDLGLYQLFFLKKIPVHAAVHEMVELVKERASADEAKFVNAVLRRATRERPTLLAALRAKRETEPWVYYSHPRWLWEQWVARWGREQTEALCEWNNTPPPIYIRLNTLRPLEGRASSLRSSESIRSGVGPSRPSSAPTSASQELDPPNDIKAEPSGFHPLCWRVADTAGMFQAKSWREGRFYVQDPSTLVAVDMLDPQPGESMLDMCAAPGGKTTYIAQKMQNRGRIIAADSSSERLGRLTENCSRLGVNIVTTLATPQAWLAPLQAERLGGSLRGAEFDRVLVDAPCSNTGVLRRRVDLRWRIEEKEITRLAALQGKLLATAARLTRPGGVLVYSTCSLEREENDCVVERFSEQHPEFTLETTRSTFPPRDHVDGAFVARFLRRGTVIA